MLLSIRVSAGLVGWILWAHQSQGRQVWARVNGSVNLATQHLALEGLATRS